jgi:hypothetical protein
MQCCSKYCTTAILQARWVISADRMCGSPQEYLPGFGRLGDHSVTNLAFPQGLRIAVHPVQRLWPSYPQAVGKHVE